MRILFVDDDPQHVDVVCRTIAEATGAHVEVVSTVEDAVSALVSLGFTDKDARKRVERAAKNVDPDDLGRLVQAAFRG